MKIPQEDLFSSQTADYKSETQLKARSPTDILQNPHPDLELYFHILEINEHMFFKKVTLNGSFLKKKNKNKTKKKQKKKKEEEEEQKNNLKKVSKK